MIALALLLAFQATDAPAAEASPLDVIIADVGAKSAQPQVDADIPAAETPAAQTELSVEPATAFAAEDAGKVMADVTLRACLPLAQRTMVLGAGADADSATLATIDLEAGIDAATRALLGADGAGLIADAMLAIRTVDDAHIVLADGGTMGGCRVILASARAIEKAEGRFALALVSAGFGDAGSSFAPGGKARQRKFLRRDADGKPYLVALYVPLGSDDAVRMIATVNLVPPTVNLPEGF